MNHINIYSNLIKELENKSISLSKFVFITYDGVENMQYFIDYINILNPDVYFIFCIYYMNHKLNICECYLFKEDCLINSLI